jgi:hypothetical protein
MAVPTHSGPRPLIQFRNHFSQMVGFLGRVISPLQGRWLHTGQHKHRINAYTQQTSMPWVGFEPTIPASERTKTVHALDRAATVTGEVLTKVTMEITLGQVVTPRSPVGSTKCFRGNCFIHLQGKEISREWKTGGTDADRKRTRTKVRKEPKEISRKF